MNLLIWISLLVSSYGSAQNATELYRFANSCFEQKNYEGAIQAYNRLIFFDSENLGKKSFFNLGTSYLAMQRYNEAAVNFDLAYNNTSNDSLRIACTFYKCLSYLLEKNFEYAMLEIYNLPDQLNEANQQKKLFYEASVHLLKDEFNEADELYTKLFQQKNTSYETYQSMRKQFNKANRLKVKTAKILSYIIPGAGQMYAGDVKNSLNSLLLSASFFTLYLVVAQTVSPIEAVIGISPWFQRYYQGGVKHAGMIATEKKEKIKKQHFVKLIELYRTFNNEKNK